MDDRRLTDSTVARLLHDAARQLAAAGVDTPELDAELLLARVLDVDRAWLMAHPEHSLTPAQRTDFEQMVRRRAQREPLAYITGQRWFYDILLHVTPAVLIPRPETEELVELALAWLQAHPATVVADIGTGSGTIALAIARHTPPDVRVLATDISPEALNVARDNARRLDVAERVHFLQGDLLAALPGPVDLIVANLPYVAERDRADLMPEVGQFEPEGALFSGPAGLNHLQRLLAAAPDYLRPGGAILLEIGYDQGEAVRALARQHFSTAAIRIHQDLAGHDRLLIVETVAE